MISAVFQGQDVFRRPLWSRLLLLARLSRRYGSRFVRYGLKQTTLLAPAPLHALLGYSSLIYGLLYGMRVVIADRFNPARVLELIETNRVVAIIVAPTMLHALLNSPDFARRDHTSLCHVIVSSAPCPPELARRARAGLGCPVYIAFGATEVGGATLFTKSSDADPLQTETVGKPLAGMQARVVDDARRSLPAGQVGELALRLQSAMLGYYKAADLTAQALDAEGWYYTGDLATMDSDGYVRIVGRKKDMIIRGGQNVFPAEIESHLLSKPGVANVAVVGVPDPLAGERAWAFVVPQPGATLTPAAIWDYCRKDLAAYKVPDQVRIVESLPVTSTGKVQKFLLREQALREREPAPRGETPAPGA
jgi:acyl-CoA synthetase (AMP-forming)/AMP-acid ligase II